MTDSATKTASEAIDERRDQLAEAVTALQYERHPELEARYGVAGRRKCFEDVRYHLAYLSEALSSSLPSLFADYIGWARVMLEARGVVVEDLADNLDILREALARELDGEARDAAVAYVDAGLARLPIAHVEPPSFLIKDAPHEALAREYLDALLAGDRRMASRLVLDAADAGVSVRDVYLHVFQSSQHEIGRLWQMNRISVAQEHYATAATQLVMSQLYPRVFATEKNGRTLVATCVADNLHEIGVRMISDFFELEGWDTFYLGANVPARDVVRTIVERDADVLAISATLGFHVRKVVELVSAVRADSRTADVKILVGGHPFNAEPGLAASVGADASATDAADVVAVANRLVESAEA